MLRFGTAGIRGSVRDAITPEAVARIGRAAAIEGDEFAVARDGRETGSALLDAAVAGLKSGGASIERLGRLPTPALAYASRGRCGLMVTASHNPPGDNGIKLFRNGREFDSAAERRIEAALDDSVLPRAWDQWGTADSRSILPAYRRAVHRYVQGFGTDPTDVSIVLDCGAGTAGAAAPDILRQGGASVRTLNGTIDGTFPARPSKPTIDTIGTLRRFVAAGPADLGIAFDGDADRLVVVDGAGEVVHEDTILAILAERYVRRAACADPVVITTPNASDRIDERVRAAGGRVERTALGQLHDGIDRIASADDPDMEIVFAAEPWKHIHSAFGGWIDGIVSAAILPRLIAETALRELRAPIRERPYLKGSVQCPGDLKRQAMERLEEVLRQEFPHERCCTEYGIRLVLEEDGWLLVRPSGTEPKIRFYVESEHAEALVARLEELVVTTISGVSTGGQ